MLTLESQLQWTELDQRFADGVTVTLLWEPSTDSLVVSVHDDELDVYEEIAVPDPALALDVFHHPFAFQTTDSEW